MVAEYVSDSRYSQAILIDGDWGSGKTYFVTNKLIPKLEERVNPLLPNKIRIFYISLYGIESLKQILDELYFSFMASYIDSKVPIGNSEQIGKGINFISKLVSVSLKAVNFDTGELPKLSDFQKLKNAIIIFDDIERCNISVNEVFGFLNNLVEHNEIKVILIANESEIGKLSLVKQLPQKYRVVLDQSLIFEKQKKDDIKKLTEDELKAYAEKLFSNDIIYKKIKEKLIGVTIHYKPDFRYIFDDIVKCYIKDNSSEEYIKGNKDLILNLFEEENHYNLRTLIFAIISFERINMILQEKIPYCDYLKQQIELILKYCVTLSVWIKLGNKPYSWDSNVKSGSICLKENSLWGLGDAIQGYKFVDDYLLYRSLDEIEIKNVVERIIKEQKERDDFKRTQDALYFNKLYEWWKMEDNELIDTLDGVLQDLKDNKYTLVYLKDIMVYLLQLKHHGFQDIEINDYVEEMKSLAEKSVEEIDTERLKLFSTNKEFLDSYNTFFAPVLEVINQKKEKDRMSINDCFTYDPWSKYFYEYCNKNKNEILREHKFFATINVDKLLSILKNSNSKEVFEFLDAINLVYNFGNLNDFFKRDLENLNYFINKFDVKTLAGKGKTKRIALIELEKKLLESIQQIAE